MKKFKEVMCIKAGKYDNISFKVGDIYAIVGSNNGEQLVCEDNNLDTRVMYLFACADETITNRLKLLCINDCKDYPQFIYLD